MQPEPSPEQSPALPPFAILFQMVNAKWVSSAISVAAKLGIADCLESGPKTTGELAQRLNLHEMSLYRLLRALASVGVFHEGADRLFSQTVLSEPLRSNAKPSLRNMAMMRAAEILSNCRQAMRPDSTLLVIDRVIGPPNQPDQAKLLDLEMMVSPGGLERSKPEWHKLFATSGFRLERIISMPTPQSILEATPA